VDAHLPGVLRGLPEPQEAGGLTDIQRAARFYYLQRCAFGGQVTNQTFGISPNHYPPIKFKRKI
jgi:DNA adenine methylase